MTKKKMWDNSNMQEEIQWGNIELPGVPDEVLLTKNWNRVAANKEAAITREGSEEFRRKRLEAIKENNQDPEYRKRYLKGNAKKYNDPEYWENYYKAIKKRDSDPEYHKQRIAASNAKIAIKISTPEGVFDSISDAARHYGLTSEGMRNRVRSPKWADYKKIEK